MQRHQPGLAEFRPANREDRIFETNVRELERHGFGNPQARDDEESKQREVGQPSQPEWRGQVLRGLEQLANLLVRVQVGRLSATASRQETWRWDFGLWIRRASPPGEA